MVRNVVKNMSVEVAMPSTSTNSNSKTTLKLSSMEKEKEKEKEGEWEKRPGGMLVQKRTDDVAVVPVKCIRIRVAYGSARYEFSISSQATFGELKKLLTAQSGLHHWEQTRITYKGKEKEDKQFLDICGVKDRSKLILTEDPCSKEKRLLEMHKNDKLQRAQRAIAEVATEVDSLADQVSGIEKSVGNGFKVAEVRISTLIELLMRQAVKLDSIISAGIEVSALKNLQAKRVQKCVETLDTLKISNASLKPVVVTSTTKWETFDPSPTTTSHYWNLLD